MDFMASKKLSIRDYHVIVIDEADRLLDMGFYPDIKKILSHSLPREERRTMLLSATMSTRVSNIAWEYMNDPVNISIEPEQVTVDLIDQKLFHLSKDEKLPFLLGYLKNTQAENALIFTNTKHMAEELAKRLEINGYPTFYLMGDLAQKKRLSVINAMKQGKIKYLVATDVAARGLHIDHLDLVVNYDLPEDPENYVHRIGRTARAGRSGQAISLACEKYVYSLPGIEKYISMKIPVGEITEESFAEDVSKNQRIVLSSHRDDPRGGHSSRPARKPGSGSGENRKPRDFASEGRKPRNRPSVPAQKDFERKKPGSGGKSAAPALKTYAKQGSVASNPKRARSVDERLAYYKKKYGDDFVPDEALLARLKAEEAQEKVDKSSGSKGKKPRPQTSGKDQKKVPSAKQGSTRVKTSKEDTNKKKASGGIKEWFFGLFRGKKQSR